MWATDIETEQFRPSLPFKATANEPLVKLHILQLGVDELATARNAWRNS
jgi:hypothetical protein